MTTLVVVVGGMYGSEAKGHVTAKVVKDTEPGARLAVVRVAGPNAGHTAYDKDGNPHAFRQLPVGMVIEREPGVVGMIAAGSEIDFTVLMDEIREAKALRIPFELWIDPEATIITQDDKNDETFASHHDLVAKIGSTGKGIGAARAGRLMREPDRRLGDHPDLVAKLRDQSNVYVGSVADQIRRSNYDGVIIEGTQGYALGLHAGHYPQCTSSNCRAIDFLSMVGISPWEAWVDGLAVVVVARVYPIRVAGNSGPLKDETTWEELGLPEERTTVTKKVRRVGGEDWDLVRRAVIANGGPRSDAQFTVSVALTMVDQKFPNLRDMSDPRRVRAEPGFDEWLMAIEMQIGAPVSMLTTGPNTHIWKREM